MTKAQVTETIRDIILTDWGYDEDEVTAESRFDEDLIMDSLDVVEVIMAAEERFDLHIPDEDCEKLTSIPALAEYICQQKGITE